MATNLGLITHTAKAHAHELASGGSGDRLPERGFTDAWGSNKTQNRRLELINPLLHSQILDNAFLDLF